jgi:hypothetical protein
MASKDKYFVEFVLCERDGTWSRKKYSVPEAVFTGSHGDAVEYCKDKLNKHYPGSELIFVSDYYMKSKKMGL